ncbi:MAG: SDR family NAD(P)-dependent oxidoreductase [Bacteroidales bacterium]|nr:SDR family NAD(P)-dependent oxidoreductase [Bacteroidales bacterium]
METKQQVILLTGASSGIGYSTAEMLLRQGHIIYGASRRVERMQSLSAAGLRPVCLDVTDEAGIGAVVDRIIAEQGRIDVLINNAGYGFFGAIEDVPLEEARRQLEVNVFGMAALIRKVMPYMRAQGGGRIINIASMAGRVVLPMGGWYHVSKYAVEALSDALRLESGQFGIKVVLIEPGGIKTDWGLIAADHLSQTSVGGAYEELSRETASGIRKTYQSSWLSKPEVIARAVSRAVNSRRPRIRYTVGFGARISVLLHTLLPARLFDRLVSRLYLTADRWL